MKSVFFFVVAALAFNHANASTPSPVAGHTATATLGLEPLQPLASQLALPAALSPAKVTCYYIKFWSIFGGGWHSLGCYGYTVVSSRTSEPLTQTPTSGEVAEGNKTLTVTYNEPIPDDYVVMSQDGVIDCSKENTSPYSTITVLKGKYAVKGNTVTYDVIVK